MITQWFDPEPTFKGLLFARELCAQGHEVEVITGFPNYPGGRLYPGFKMRPWQSKVIDGVRVRRVAIYPSHSGSALGRIANYASFGLSGTVGALAAKRADVTYLYHPPGTAALAAIVLKIVKRTPFVIDVQDIWPDTLAATGMLTNRRILGFVGWWMRQVYRIASHVVVLSPGFRRLLLERGVPDAKLSVIPNWTYDSPASYAPDELATEPAFAGRFNVLFAGSMGKAQKLETMLEAAVLLRARAPEVQFILLGSGVELEALQTMSRELALDNIIFLPRRPTDEAARVLQAADVLLVHLKDDPLFAVTLPSKTQAYLQAGKPILMGVRGDAAQLIEEAEAGIAFEPENPEALAAAVEAMIAMAPAERDRMGASGKAFYDRRLALPIGVAAFVKLFQKTAAASMSQPGTPTGGVACETRERTVKTRPARLADAKVIAQLVAGSFSPTLAPYMVYTQAGADAFLSIPLRYPTLARDRDLSVAEDAGGAIIGYADFRIQNGNAFLSYLCVDSAARGQGVALELIASLQKRVPTLLTMSLDVFADNAPAIALYRKLGFIEVGETVWTVRQLPTPSAQDINSLEIPALAIAMAGFELYGFCELTLRWCGVDRKIGRIGSGVLRCFSAEDFRDDGLLCTLRTIFPEVREALLIRSADDAGQNGYGETEINRSLRMRWAVDEAAGAKIIV